MPALRIQLVAAVRQAFEQHWNGGMIHRIGAVITGQILLAHISDIARFAIVSEQMIKRLVPIRTHILRNCLIPFFAIGEGRINVKHHTPESEELVPNRIAKAEMRMCDQRGGSKSTRKGCGG